MLRVLTRQWNATSESPWTRQSFRIRSAAKLRRETPFPAAARRIPMAVQVAGLPPRLCPEEEAEPRRRSELPSGPHSAPESEALLRQSSALFRYRFARRPAPSDFSSECPRNQSSEI